MAPVVHLAPQRRRLPVRTRLSLAELDLLVDRLGNPRLPLDLDGTTHDDEAADRLQERLADGAPSVGQRAHGLVRAAGDQARREPATLAARLTEVGLLDDGGTPVGDVVAAFGVLAAPEALLVLDLAVRREAGEARLRSWFAVTGSQVVQLSTVSGVVLELAWYDVVELPDALARAAAVDEDTDGAADSTDDSDGGDHDPVAEVGSPLELPFELFTDGTEAVRRGREDLLAELVRIAPGAVRVDGAELAPAAAAGAVTALEQAARGRLRVLVTAPASGPQTEPAGRRTVGVVSWLRVGAGWRSLTPLTVAGVPTVRIATVTGADLARGLAPVLAEVVR